MMTICLDEQFDPDSPTLSGPFPVVGDCVSDQERFAAAMLEFWPVRNGDLGLWFMPSQEEGERYSCKWLLADASGGLWLACKYFAVRYRPDFHRPIARVVALISDEPGSFDPELSARLAKEIADLRAQPPDREDVIVFPQDLLEQHAIVAAINGRHQRS